MRGEATRQPSQDAGIVTVGEQADAALGPQDEQNHAHWRLAACGGLDDVTLRHVAAEAGVPARQLQYYFGTREHLLLGALEILNADAERRAAERMSDLGPDPSPRAVARAVLLELLPLNA